MIIEIVIALVIGILAGCISGLLPGIHINLVSAFLLSAVSLSVFSGMSPMVFVVFIIAMSITHTFLDFLPSVFLGAPDDDTALSVLPGHQMLKQGKAHEAVLLTAIGGAIAIIFVLLISPLFVLFLPVIYSYIRGIMPFVLILASAFMLLSEKSSKLLALIIFLLAGFLGISVLNLPLKEPLLPLLTGLFGASTLIVSIKNKTKLPKQKILKLRELKIKKKELLNATVGGVMASPFCSFLPGMGSGQAAVIGSEVVGDISKREFLILLGMINTIVMSLSFVTLYTINKARTGSAVAISKIISSLSLSNLVVILIVILISSFLAFFLTIFISKKFSVIIQKISYTKLSYFVLAFLFFVVLIFSGFLGLLVFVVSTFTGLTAIVSGVRRTHLMACLLLPTILFYLL